MIGKNIKHVFLVFLSIYKKCTFFWCLHTIDTIPRTNNRYADAMTSATSLVPIELEDEETILTIHKLSSPSYQNHLHHVLACLITNDDAFQNWYYDIYNYLKDQSIPSYYNKNERLRL